MTTQLAVTPQTSSYEELHLRFGSLIHKADHEAMDLALACVLANGRHGDAVAMFLVAPPSTGKTEIINAMDGVDWTYLQSEMTPKTFASGFRAGKGAADPSLLTRLSNDGKTCLLNKEFATVLNKRQSDRDEVLSQLREIMDGSLAKDFGTGARTNWKGKLGLLVGVTPEIDRYWAAQTSLGDRWLWVRLRSAMGTPDRLTVARAALGGDKMSNARRAVLRSDTKQLLESLKTEPDPEVSDESLEFLATIADRVARGRTPVKRDSEKRTIDVKPEPEGPARLAKAFRRLAESLALVRGHDRVMSDDLKAIRRVAEDTVPKARAAVYRALYRRKMTVQELVKITGISQSAINRTLEELELLELVQEEIEKTGTVGRPSGTWSLTIDN